MMFTQWFAEHCSHAKFLFKTDDDVFVYTPNLLQILSTTEQIQTRYWLGLYKCCDNCEVVRDPEHKWYVSHRDYAPKVYPHYCDGKAYILSKDLVMGVNAVSRHATFLPIEDAFVGVCLSKLEGPGVTIQEFATMLDSTQYAHMKGTIISHRYPIDTYIDTWYVLTKGMKI